MKHKTYPDKPFKTYEEQLELLRNKYGLRIENYDFALEQLKFFGYYDMISGYRDSFMRNDLFKENLSFQYIMDFIILDKNIQAVFLQCSTMAEQTFKAKLSHFLSEKYGVFQEDYLNPDNFKKSRGVVELSAVLKQFHYVLKGKSRGQMEPTAHYLREYNHVPAWVLFKNCSFSTVTDLFALLNANDRKTVAHMIIPQELKVSEKIDLIFASLDLIRRYRNVIAHNLNFLYYKVPSKDRLPSRGVMMKLFPKEILRKYTVEFKKGESNIYPYLLCIMLIFNNDYLNVNVAETMKNILLIRDRKLVRDYFQVAKLPEDFMEKLDYIIEYGTIFKEKFQLADERTELII